MTLNIKNCFWKYASVKCQSLFIHFNCVLFELLMLAYWNMTNSELVHRTGIPNCKCLLPFSSVGADKGTPSVLYYNWCPFGNLGDIYGSVSKCAAHIGFRCLNLGKIWWRDIALYQSKTCWDSYFPSSDGSDCFEILSDSSSCADGLEYYSCFSLVELEQQQGWWCYE